MCCKGDPGLPGPPGVPGPTVSYSVVILLLSNRCTAHTTIFLGNKLQAIRYVNGTMHSLQPLQN